MLLLFLLFQFGLGRSQQVATPQGFIASSCSSSLFWMKLDNSFLQGKYFTLEIIDPFGVPVQLDETLEARCGYTLMEDVWGNTIFRASLLACHVINEVDERFSLTVDIKVSLFPDLRAATAYRHTMYCSYSPWAPREIVCEENYMEVSVKSDVPVISDDETAEWMSALPEAQKVVYQIWQLIFYSPSGRKTTVVSDADKLGYGFNNTLARVFLRSPYSTNETELSVVNGVTMSTISSTSMYKQRWLLLLIDTTVSCPVDGTSFTDAVITWTVPRTIPRLVLQEPTFTSQNISMGVDGRRIENPENLNYTLEHNSTHIGITIPIGASGGRLMSMIANGIYGVIYRISLLLEHTWTDTDWHLTKYTVIKSITTPFMPRIPTVVNKTVPDTRLFDLDFGVFLPDVTLVTITIGDTTLSPEELEKNYKSSEMPFPNGTKGFNLKVPFDDPNVLKESADTREAVDVLNLGLEAVLDWMGANKLKLNPDKTEVLWVGRTDHPSNEYVNKNETKYLLYVNYTLAVGPERKPYHHPADVECTIADIELPEGIGYCDKDNLYLAVTVTGLNEHWSLYVGNKPLNQATALSDGYLITTNATHLRLQVPLFAVGIIYEEVSFERIQARFDLTLKKINTMETLDIFSARCSFRASEFVVCYPNGTVTVSALMKTVPSIDMGKTRLKDHNCKPLEFTKEQAFFQFHVSNCGTSLRFEGEHLIYENEISFEKETLPAQGPPIITRDPDYRLTILCYYPTKETLMHSALVSGSSSARDVAPLGYGTMIARSSLPGLRRGRQVLNIAANVFKDESFTETYGSHSTAVKYSWEPTYLEVELKDEAPGVALHLDNCWVTESEDFSSIPQWNVIVDRCENKSHGSVLNFYPVTKNDRVKHPNHFKRVGIQMRIPLKKVYFHCTVTVRDCLHVIDDLSYRQCPSRRKPDVNLEIQSGRRGYVLAGPILIIHPDQVKELEVHKSDMAEQS
ncbi:uncharacterized protein LOC128340298 isoform X2 [Hemicordylus capensis]|nr:uncharacterized protein LOC128340298 isoform X2 [Hemicordylus capensis]